MATTLALGSARVEADDDRFETWRYIHILAERPLGEEIGVAGFRLVVPPQHLLECLVAGKDTGVTGGNVLKRPIEVWMLQALRGHPASRSRVLPFIAAQLHDGELMVDAVDT